MADYLETERRILKCCMNRQDPCVICVVPFC
jgi:hypothetical protein